MKVERKHEGVTPIFFRDSFSPSGPGPTCSPGRLGSDPTSTSSPVSPLVGLRFPTVQIEKYTQKCVPSRL